MDIHRYEKLWFAAALVLIVGFIATVTYGAVGAGVTMVSDEGGTVDPQNLNDDERFSDTGVEKVGEDEYEVTIIAVHPAFIPGQIEVPADSRVTFYVTSQDVLHGFEVVGTNINTMVIPGEVSKVTAEFEEPGEYGIICNEYCGENHHNMEAQLTVVPEDEWEGTDE